MKSGPRPARRAWRWRAGPLCRFAPRRRGHARGRRRPRARRIRPCAGTASRPSAARGSIRGEDTVRMRFASDLREFSTARARAVFSAHSWLYCRREIGYQAAGCRHAPAVFRAERAEENRDRATVRFGEGPRAVGTKEACNGSSDRIGPALGPGAGRHFGGRRLVAAATLVAAPAALAQQHKKPRQAGGRSRRPRRQRRAQAAPRTTSRSSCIRPG